MRWCGVESNAKYDVAKGRFKRRSGVNANHADADVTVERQVDGRSRIGWSMLRCLVGELLGPF